MVKCSIILGFAAFAVMTTSSFAATTAPNVTTAPKVTTAAPAVVTPVPNVFDSGSAVADSSASGVSATDAGGDLQDTVTNTTDVREPVEALGEKSAVDGTEAPATTAAPAVNATVVPTQTTAAPAATTKAPTPTTKAGPTTNPGQTKLVPGYYDCGGVGFNYTVYMTEVPAFNDPVRLSCESGYRCQDVDGRDLFTCNVWPSPEPVAFYGQCGGSNYDGQTFCAPGSICKYVSASFSQCLPTY